MVTGILSTGWKEFCKAHAAFHIQLSILLHAFIPNYSMSKWNVLHMALPSLRSKVKLRFCGTFLNKEPTLCKSKHLTVNTQKNPLSLQWEWNNPHRKEVRSLHIGWVVLFLTNRINMTLEYSSTVTKFMNRFPWFWLKLLIWRTTWECIQYHRLYSWDPLLWFQDLWFSVFLWFDFSVILFLNSIFLSILFYFPSVLPDRVHPQLQLKPQRDARDCKMDILKNILHCQKNS